MNRLEICASIVAKESDDYSILDVGCRKKGLKPLLKGVNRYHGIDLEDAEEVTGHDLENPIPLNDSEFDIVVALDVVEHVENAHQLMSELIRVADKIVIVSLPNMYYWRFRVNVILGVPIGGKYIFSPRPIKDRHRWLPSYISSREFVQQNSGGFPVDVVPVIAERRRNKLIEAMDILGSKLFPNVFAYGGMYIIRKK